MAALNEDLEKVVPLFPDVRPEVFRELLLSFSGESRLYLAAEALLMNKNKVVRGRWRVDARAESDSPKPTQLLPRKEQFRSETYKNAVRLALCEEFKSLSRSTVEGILAEHNYSYTDARPVLQQSAASSWTFFLPSWLSRRQAPSISDHPLMMSSTTSVPQVKPQCSSELEQELEESLVSPARLTRQREQIKDDAREAEAINDAQAEAESATYDCECCFNSVSWERISACSGQGHFLCHGCLRQTMSEVIYGQGWSRSVESERSTLRCVALGSDDCKGCVPQDQVKLAITNGESGEQTWARFEERLARDSLAKSGLEVLQCPSCHYAELAPAVSMPSKMRFLRPALALLMAAILLLNVLAWLRPVLLTTASFLAFHPLSFGLLPMILSFLRTLSTNNNPTLSRNIRRCTDALATAIGVSSTDTPSTPLNHGRKFICRAPSCSETSCLTCNLTPWIDPHTCHAALATSLRTHVEAALSAAAKRTCPGCGLSFVKAAGCNKLACPCGYAMCYVCRADVRRAGYAHFCPHFRPAGTGECPVGCGRCDLYRDEEVSMEEVRKVAEREWWERQDRRSGFEGERGREVVECALEGLGEDSGTKGKRRWALF